MRDVQEAAKRVLILEDDYGLRTSLRLFLEQEGYVVGEADDAEIALDLDAAEPFDVMLVDLMLGGIDGFTFIRSVRPRTTAPIIVISARDGSKDVVAALEAGADDYVRKPFDVAEVRARIKAALRRPDYPLVSSAGGYTPVGGIVLDSTDGPLVFDPAAATLRRGSEDLHLTSTEFKLLLALTAGPGRVMTRENLVSQMWPEGHHGDVRVVDVHVSRLRNKVDNDPVAGGVISTVRGLGYRLDPR
ncbi:response regulator transcription factor [Nocardioides sp. NPDC101246]|uniref:response regulator transcription factor n=1 Tax=Nocardioides sp. NPDC101246 TaxID=3364336 RepID=UPI00381792F0